MRNWRSRFVDRAAATGAMALSQTTLSAAERKTSAPAAGRTSTVRDKFWMYSCYEGFTGFPSVPGESRMTPAEAAAYFNVPNVYVATITYGKEPCKALPPVDFHPYLVSFRSLKRVVWFLSEEQSIVTDGTVATVRSLAKTYPNIVGIAVDDYFAPTVKGYPGSPLTLDEIDYIQGQMRNVDDRHVDLWVVAYRQIQTLEEDFARLERRTPGKRKLLGCYMWDFGDNKPVPLPLMQKQCRLGLEWLRKGRIEGMMFLGNFLCDRPLEAVEWTRRWIQEVGDEPL